MHSGILASAQWFFTRIIPQIFLYVSEQTKLGNRKIKSFIITGHSLGAGTAAVLTMMVVDHIEQLRELSHNPDFEVHCYGYAPVASVSHDLSEKYGDHIDSFVCQDDIVGRLSYGTATCAKELVMDALIAADGLGGYGKVGKNPALRKECFDIIQTRRREIYQGKEPRYPLLYVPGCVYQFRRGGSKQATKLAQDIKLPGTSPQPDPFIQRRASSSSQRKGANPTTSPFSPSQSEPALPTGEEVTFTLHKSSSMLSEEAYMSKTCLEDHAVVTYLTAFQTARQDCMRQASFRKSSFPKPTSKNSESTASLSSSSTLELNTTSSPPSLNTSHSKIKLSTNSTSFTRLDQEAT